MRAAIYARVSTDQQRDNYSVSTQISAIIAAAKKAGYSIVGDRYIDPATGQDCQPGNNSVMAFVDDYTSREISRPGLDAALRYLESEGYDILLVHSLDRMARDPYIRETLEREFKARGAGVLYIMGNYEESAEGEVRKDLDATFAKWENAKRVERCNRGKRGKAEAGKFVAGRSPYGYRIDPDAPGGLAVNEQEAEIVRWIFMSYVENNESLRGIAEALSSQAIPPRMGGDEWGKSSVARILANSVYAGSYYYNKHKRINLSKMIERDQEEWIKIETTPIIDNWMYKAALEKLEESRKARRKEPTRFYMLSGLVYCADCGRPFGTQTALAGRNRRVRETQSYRHRAKEGHCSNKSVSARTLEPIVWREIKAILLDPVRLHKGYNESIEAMNEARSRQRAHHETLQRNLKKLETVRTNLNTAYLDPDIGMTKTEYIEQKSRISDEINDIKKRIEQADNELAQAPTPEALESLEVFAGKIKSRLKSDHDLEKEDIRQVLDILHVKIFLSMNGSMNIRGWFGQERDGVSSITY